MIWGRNDHHTTRGDISMIGIQPVPDPAGVDVHEHGLMLPIPAPERDTIMLEPRDGNDIRWLVAHAVRLERNGTTVFRCSKVRINVLVTGARVALACSKYDKGGGWIGSPSAVIVLNAASKGLAAVRRHGKMMVGHARYPWVSAVGSTARQGVGSIERLVLDGKTNRTTSVRLTLEVRKGDDSASVAAEVARCVAGYRLSSETNLSEDERNTFAALTNVRPLPSGAKNIIQFHRMPTFYFVNQHSARMVSSALASGPGEARLRPVGAAGAMATLSAEPPDLDATALSPAPTKLVSDSPRARLLPPAPGQRIVVSLDDL